jgi:hypothetical protein
MSKKRQTQAWVTATDAVQTGVLVRAMRNGRQVVCDGTAMYVVRREGDVFTLSTHRGTSRRRSRKHPSSF